MILEGAADTAAFEQYVESLLALHLSAGQIVVMDNLRCHKSERVSCAVRGLAIRLTCPPSKKPSETAQNGSPVEWVLAHAKCLRKPSAKPCSPSPLLMHVDGFATAAMFPLEKAVMANSIL